MLPATWPAFVARHADGDSMRTIAAKADVNVSTVWRWLHSRGKELPTVQAVFNFAEAYEASWIEALTAAGYLTPEQAAEVGHVPLSDVSTSQLLIELSRRTEGISHPA